MTAAALFPRADDRALQALGFAVLASLTLHALVLFIAPAVREPTIATPPPSVITAELRVAPRAEAPVPPSAVQAAPPVREPLPPVTPPARPETPKPLVPAPAKITTPAPAPVAVAPPPVTAAPPPQAAPVESSATAAKSASGPATSPTSAPAVVASSAPSSAAVSAEGLDANALLQYKIQLAKYSEKYMKYPRAALEQNIEGIAYVKIIMGADGRSREVTIATSSGVEMLDKAALDMVRKALPITEIPGALRNKEFPTILKVDFNITRKSAG